MRYAALRSCLAMSAPGPQSCTLLAASATDAYCREHREGLMASLILRPIGADRLTIILNLLGRFFFGMMPIGLIWVACH